ncbi:MAG: T9SS type A sorting domain-containing protein, partial [Bacteroidota bacterium]
QLGNTSADAIIYEVWLHQSVVNNATAISAKNPLNMIVYPNPAKRTFTAEFALPEGGEVYYYITNPTGKVIQKGTWNLGAGKHNQFITLPENTASGTYSLTVSLNGVWFTTHQVIIE